MTRWPVGRYAFLSGFIYPTKGIQWSAQHVEGLIFFKRFTYGSGTAPFSEEDIVVRFVEEESPLFVRL